MLMTYERFGAVALPRYDPSEPIGSFPSRSSYAALPGGGAFRLYGDRQAPRGPRTVRRTGLLLQDSLEALDTAFAALVAQRGRVDRLYGRRADGTVVWTPAELVSVEALSEPRTLFRFVRYVALDVDTEFTLFSGPWYGNQHGANWVLDSSNFLDTGLVLDQAVGDTFTLSHTGVTACAVTNGGNAAIANAVLLITAGSAAITGVSISSTGPDGNDQAQLLYAGTINATKTLRIDSGRQAVEHNNAGGYIGDYAQFELDTGHVIAEWLRLDPGTTTLEVTITSSQDATMLVTFSDGHE